MGENGNAISSILLDRDNDDQVEFDADWLSARQNALKNQKAKSQMRQSMRALSTCNARALEFEINGMPLYTSIQSKKERPKQSNENKKGHEAPAKEFSEGVMEPEDEKTDGQKREDGKAADPTLPIQEGASTTVKKETKSNEKQEAFVSVENVSQTSSKRMDDFPNNEKTAPTSVSTLIPNEYERGHCPKNLTPDNETFNESPEPFWTRNKRRIVWRTPFILFFAFLITFGVRRLEYGPAILDLVKIPIQSSRQLEDLTLPPDWMAGMFPPTPIPAYTTPGSSPVTIEWIIPNRERPLELGPTRPPTPLPTAGAPPPAPLTTTPPVSAGSPVQVKWSIPSGPSPTPGPTMPAGSPVVVKWPVSRQSPTPDPFPRRHRRKKLINEN